MVSWDTSMTMEARVEVDAATLVNMGDEYTPTLQMGLVGESNEGWKNPVYLDIQLPDDEDVLSNKFKIPQLPLGRIHDFPFPSFTVPSGRQKKMVFTASTKQNTNLSSSLVVGKKLLISEDKYTDQMSIKWHIEFKMDHCTRGLTPGCTYKFVFPLVLKGLDHVGWNEPVFIQVYLPDGKKVAKMVDPKQIPLRETNKGFTSRRFTAPGSDQTITLVVSSTQLQNLHSMLHVGPCTTEMMIHLRNPPLHRDATSTHASRHGRASSTGRGEMPSSSSSSSSHRQLHPNETHLMAEIQQLKAALAEQKEQMQSQTHAMMDAMREQMKEYVSGQIRHVKRELHQHVQGTMDDMREQMKEYVSGQNRHVKTELHQYVSGQIRDMKTELHQYVSGQIQDGRGHGHHDRHGHHRSQSPYARNEDDDDEVASVGSVETDYGD